MPEPENVSNVHRLLGMTNQLNKFSPTLAEKSKPLRELLNKENQWAWDTPQKEAFKALKKELCLTPVLAHYNPSLETTVSANLSSHGLGVVIMQKQEDGNLRPAAYASRSMSATEERYAQVKKEALVVTWAFDTVQRFPHRSNISSRNRP